MTCFLIWRMGPVVVGLSSQRKGEEGGASVVMAKFPIPGCLQRDQERLGGLWPGLQHRQCMWRCKVTAGVSPFLLADAMT